MSNLNHHRPILATKGKLAVHKHAERNAWISTKRLAKVKSWQEFIQIYEEKGKAIKESKH